MFAAQSVHVRAAVLVSALMLFPLPHVGCAVHRTLRCKPDVWYVLLGHALQARLTVLESALTNCPLPHVACAVHDVVLELDDGWYVFAPHAEHALFFR